MSDEGDRSTQPPLVLVVEDSSVQRAILRQLLEQAAYRVIDAKTAEEAEAKMLKLQPDAVLLTWELPDAEGPQLLKRWRTIPNLETVPVLMLTSHGEPEKIYHALECGAVDFLKKPPVPVELHARIRNAVKIKSLHDDLRRLASRDPLTGLLNRRAFLAQLGHELARSRRYGRQLSLSIIDIDHFKGINDRFGHDVGDLALTQLSGYLTQNLREVDVVARYGGEEFILLLPETPLQRAKVIVDRLREGTQSVRWGNAANVLTLTFSAGISCFVPAQATHPDALIKLADVALYRAKNMGRNRTEIAAQEDEHDVSMH